MTGCADPGPASGLGLGHRPKPDSRQQRTQTGSTTEPGFFHHRHRRSKHTEPPKPLAGAELLAKVKELEMRKIEKFGACGYFSVKEDGGERDQFHRLLRSFARGKRS